MDTTNNTSEPLCVKVEGIKPTITEAEALYQKISQSAYGTDSHIAAKKQFDDLVTILANHAFTLEEAGAAYNMAESYSKAKKAAERRWQALVIRLSQHANTLEEAKHVCSLTPRWLRFEVKNIAMERYLSFVTTCEQAKEIYLAEWKSFNSKELPLKKWLSLISTVKEAKEAYAFVGNNSTEKGLAWQVWISAITSVDEAKEASLFSLRNISIDTPVEWHDPMLAWQKWFSLISTAAEAQEAYQHAPNGSDFQRQACHKWLTLITTEDEAIEAYNNAPADSDFRLLILELIKLFSHGY